MAHYSGVCSAPDDRDRGRLTAPPLPHHRGVRVAYHGRFDRVKLRQEHRVGVRPSEFEVVVAQGRLNRRVSGHAQESRRRAGGNRCSELCYATTASFFCVSACNFTP